MNKPVGDLFKSAFGMKPTKIEAQNAARTFTYREYLTRLARGIFEIKCPRTWSRQYMEDMLLNEGVFCVTDSPVGVYPFMCSPYGINVQYRPTNAKITNPALPDGLDIMLGVEGVLVYMCDDRFFHGIQDLISVYAEKLADCDSAIDVNLINTKDCKVYGVPDKKTAESIRAMHDQILEGNAAVFIKKEILDGFDRKQVDVWTNHVRESFICDMVQTEKRQIIEEFLTALGINNANTDKRERLNSQEVNSNNEELKCNVSSWKENLAYCTAEVNRLFPAIDFYIGIKDYTGEEERLYADQQTDLA